MPSGKVLCNLRAGFETDLRKWRAGMGWHGNSGRAEVVITQGTALAIEVRNAQSIVSAYVPHYALVLTRFAALDAAMLARVQPDCVLFPLFGPSFDAHQVLERLHGLRFQGTACVLTPHLPAPQMVLEELRRLAGARDLTLMEFPAPGPTQP